MDADQRFVAWYGTEHPRLVSALALATGDGDVARDATDEAFARALERWSRVQHMESPSGWTYRVALNVARRRLRRRGLERRLPTHHATQYVEIQPTDHELWGAVS